MILFPAIDLKDGACVRLIKGDMAQATVFNDDPAAQARAWVAAGFEWLHLVDLNGAFDGRPVNADAVEAILDALRETPVPVQLGGGIRDRATIDYWLGKGVRRVILGTVAVRDPDLVRAAAKDHPGRIVVGVDAKGGKVAVEGWAETSELSALDLARSFEDAGVAALLYTDVDRDGLLGGVNVEATAELAAHLSVPVIASGGLKGPEDLRALKAAEPRARASGGGIEGVVAGRALYDGRLEPREALGLLR